MKTYQYGCHPFVLSHHALGTAECDESNDGGTIFGRRGCGEFFYRESYCDERVVMTIYEFQTFLVTSVPGGGVISLFGKWAGSNHIWGRRNAAGVWGA